MIKLSLDTVCWNRKPKGKPEIGAISLSIPKNIVKISIEDFAKNVVQPYGKSWSPTIFKDGIRSNDTFVSQQVFCLDIDEGLAFDDMLERCDKSNIIPASVIKDVVGWESVSMVDIYDDTEVDDELGKYFNAEGIKKIEKKGLEDL